MSLDITIAGTAVPLEPGSLKDLNTDKQLLFELSSGLKPYLQSAIGATPDLGATEVKYSSDAASWNPQGSAVTFGLQGGAACSLQIMNKGSLGTYFAGLDSPVPVEVPVPAGRSYVKLSISFNLSASVSGTYSGGSYGVSAKLSTSDTYAVTFCKAFDRAVKVETAIAQTFAAFVLPFRERLLLDMQDGDYLWYEFDGKVGLSVGAYVGLDTAQYAGNGCADLLKLDGSPLATLSVSVKPKVKLAAMDFKMDYASRFEAVLSKAGTSGQLHLMKSDKRTDVVSATAGLMIDVNASATLTQKVSDHLSDLKTSMVQCGGGTDSSGGKAIGKVADLADKELHKYAAEVTDKLQSWLNKANGIHCNLQAAIERTQQKLLLASYEFDLTDATFAAGWNFAIAGDFSDALTTSAVTLDAGSGLEHEYRRKTSVACNFFNLWHMTSWSDFSSNVSMVYAGNNTFHMLAKVGRTTGTETVGASRSMDIYFSAGANAKTKGPSSIIEIVEVSLNIALNGSGDKKMIATVAQLLSAFDASASMADVVRNLTAFNNNAGAHVVQLLVTIPSAAFNKVQADSKSGPNDERNWNAFAAAADALNAWALRSPAGLDPQMVHFLKQYSSWEQANTTQTGESSPDRNHVGAVVVFPDEWTSLSSTSPAPRVQIAHSQWAGQRFMNFCADLQALAALETPEAVTPTWEGLLMLIAKAVQQDLEIDFLRPAALATMQLCRGDNYALTAPVSPAIPVDHFSIALRL